MFFIVQIFLVVFFFLICELFYFSGKPSLYSWDHSYFVENIKGSEEHKKIGKKMNLEKHN